jgi:hypothetical protein
MAPAKADIDIEVILALTTVILTRKRKKMKRRKRWWVNPYLAERRIKGRFAKDVSLSI